MSWMRCPFAVGPLAHLAGILLGSVVLANAQDGADDAGATGDRRSATGNASSVTAQDEAEGAAQATPVSEPPGGEGADAVTSGDDTPSGRAWRRYRRLLADADARRQQALSAIATPGQPRQQVAVIASLIELAEPIERMLDDISAEVSERFQQDDLSEETGRLIQIRTRLLLLRVELLLLRSELFPAGSVDRLAAADDAESAAAEALNLVRNAPQWRAELLRMRAEALRRTDQRNRAARLLETLRDENPEAAQDEATIALQVRMAIDAGQLDRAAELLEAHRGDDPEGAPETPQLELERLRLLLASLPAGQTIPGAEQRAIGDQIEAIGRRYSRWYHHRGQTLAVEMLEASLDRLSDQRLIMAAASWYLRRDANDEAIALLQAGLQRTADAAAARSLATVAAAALEQGGRSAAAAELLAKTALRFREDPDSAPLLLQAAVMASSTEPPARASGWMQRLADTWPDSSAGQQAADWLGRQVAQQGPVSQSAEPQKVDPASALAGSPEWHRQRLGRIAELAAVGREEEASRMARYILLTRPPEDAQLRGHYERWAR